MHQGSHGDEMLICVLIRSFTENAFCVDCSGVRKMLLIILFQPFSHHQSYQASCVFEEIFAGFLYEKRGHLIILLILL